MARGRGTMHVTRVAEQVRSAPQQLDAGPLLLFLQHFDNRVEVLIRFGQRIALGRDVAVVEAVVRRHRAFRGTRRRLSRG